MQIVHAKEWGNEAKSKISEVFVEGFYQWLKYFSKDKARLVNAFRHMFNPDVFYLNVIEDQVAGIAACTNETAPAIRLDRKEFQKHLGFLRGALAHYILRREFEQKQYPFEIPAGMGMVEFVATAEEHRGKGVATAIIQEIRHTTPYTEYALEVADTNPGAIHLYQKLGFREFMRIKHKYSRRSGVNYLVYMKYLKR